MPADPPPPSGDPSRQTPWWRLARAIGCSMAPAQLIPCTVAVLLLQLTIWLLPDYAYRLETPHRSLPAWSSEMIASIGRIVRADSAVLPIDQVFSPLLAELFNLGPSWSMLAAAGVAYALWSVVGVAAARSTAVQFCRDEGPSFRLSLQWALSRWVTSLTSTVLPIGALLAIAVAIVVLSVLGSVPALGEVWLRIVAPLLALAGLAGALILTLLIVIWPLMLASIAVDDSDSFDAFSRGVSLVTSRFWTTLGLVLAYFIAASFVLLLADYVIVSAIFGVFQSTRWMPLHGEERGVVEWVAWWCRVFIGGFMASFFWSHATVLYLFLRRAVDRTPLDALAGYEDDFISPEPYPVVGIPAVRVAAPSATPTETSPPIPVSPPVIDDDRAGESGPSLSKNPAP